MALTKRAIDALKYDPDGSAAQILWDHTLPGYGVRVFASGAKSFILDYRAGGRKRRITLGRYGVLTPDQARKKAMRELTSVNNGGDPAEERRESRKAITVRDYADVYVDQYAKKRKRTWPEDRRRLDRNIIPTLGSRTLASVTRADIAKLHRTIGSRAKYEANRTAALLKVMRSVAIEWGYLPETAPSWSVKPFREQKRARWVKPDELPALLLAIDAEESVYVRGALHLALLTGMRRGELLGLRWQHVDLNRAEINLPTTKADRPHVVPLSPEAVTVLSGLPRMLGNPFVFCSPKKHGVALHDLKEPWERVRARTWLAAHPEEAATLRSKAEAHVRANGGAVESRLLLLANEEAKKRGETLRLHDVRRTTGSMLAIAGASLPLIGAVLNHSNPTTTQIYARLQDDTPRAALEKLGQRVRAAREGL